LNVELRASLAFGCDEFYKKYKRKFTGSASDAAPIIQNSTFNIQNLSTFSVLI